MLVPYLAPSSTTPAAPRLVSFCYLPVSAPPCTRELIGIRVPSGRTMLWWLGGLALSTAKMGFYALHPIARGLSPEGHCAFLMGDVLPRKTENTVYGYLTAISKLRLGILTEQGEGS